MILAVSYTTLLYRPPYHLSDTNLGSYCRIRLSPEPSSLKRKKSLVFASPLNFDDNTLDS